MREHREKSWPELWRPQKQSLVCFCYELCCGRGVSTVCFSHSWGAAGAGEREKGQGRGQRVSSGCVHTCVTSVYVCPLVLYVGCDWTAGHSGEIKDIHS